MIIDNSAVEAANEAYLRASPRAMKNVDLCFKATDLLRAAAELPTFDRPDDITVLRLGIRLINDAGASGTCALGGYYQQAVAHIRDIIEIEFLLDLFRRRPTEINRWRVCDDKSRRRNFSASALRDSLDRLDGRSDSARDAAYSLYTQHGTHVHPHRVQLISPENMMSIVGPYPSERWIVALSVDLSRAYSFAAWHIARWVDPSRETDKAKRHSFEAAFETLNRGMWDHYAQ